MTRIQGIAFLIATGLVASAASLASAGVIVDQYPALLLKRTETLRVNISDVRAALRRSGASNEPCDLEIDFIDADGTVVQTTPLRVDPSVPAVAEFQPSIEGAYRVTIHAAANSIIPACDSRNVRAGLQAEDTISGRTGWVMGWSNHNETLVRDNTAPR